MKDIEIAEVVTGFLLHSVSMNYKDIQTKIYNFISYEFQGVIFVKFLRHLTLKYSLNSAISFLFLQS